MNMMFVDESGDPGLSGMGSKAFVRVGVVIHGWKWKAWNDRLKNFKRARNLRWDDEIKAAHLRKGSGVFAGLMEDARHAFMRDLTRLIGSNPDVSILCVAIDKSLMKTGTKANPDVMSLEILLKEYNRFLGRQKDQNGIVILDPAEATKDDHLRYYQSYLQSRKLSPMRIVEGTFFAKSHTSNMIQVADVCSNVFYNHFCLTEKISGLWENLRPRVANEIVWPKK